MIAAVVPAAIIQYFAVFHKKKYQEIIRRNDYGTIFRKIWTCIFFTGSFVLWAISMLFWAAHNSGGFKALTW